METVKMFLSYNNKFSEEFSEAIQSLEKVVEQYPRQRWSSINFSVSALQNIMIDKVTDEKDIPFIIEALCNLNPTILSRNYFYIEFEEEPIEIDERDVIKAAKEKCIVNPRTGLFDYEFRDKIVLRYTLSDEVLRHE